MSRFKSIEEEGGIVEHIRNAGKDPDVFIEDVHKSLDVFGKINSRWLALRHDIGWDRAKNWAERVRDLETQVK